MGVEVQIYEKSGSSGGRCATRLWQGHAVDTGVQYFTLQTAEFKKEVLSQLFHFARPIVPPFCDRNGVAIPSTGSPRYYTLQGNNYLGHVLSAGLPLQLNAPVESVNVLEGERFEVLDRKFVAVVSCAPWPQTAKIFALNDEGPAYEPCLTALIEYAGVIKESRKFYASVDTTRESNIRWSACENHKAGRIVGEKTVFIVHASPKFSTEHLESPPEVYLPLLLEENSAIWKISGARNTALTGQLWRYARAVQSDTTPAINLPPGLFVCGDSRTESEVEKVWLDGKRAAAEVMNFLCQD